jgi:hypothetical protein
VLGRIPARPIFGHGTDPIQTPDPLFQLGGIPGQVVMDDVVAMQVEIDAFGPDGRTHQDIRSQRAVEGRTEPHALIRGNGSADGFHDALLRQKYAVPQALPPGTTGNFAIDGTFGTEQRSQFPKGKRLL